MQTPSALPQIEPAALEAAAAFNGFGSMLVITPRHLQDAATVLQAVRQNSSVVVNSSWLEDASGQRLIDFVCGGLEAVGGSAHRIAEEVFLFTPGNAKVNHPKPDNDPD
jgi:FtsZ-interacting cell division protein YlmF